MYGYGIAFFCGIALGAIWLWLEHGPSAIKIAFAIQ